MAPRKPPYATRPPERTTRALELGADGIVYKPYAHADLIEAVQAALG